MLGAALNLPAGNNVYLIAALAAMGVAFNAAALFWTRCDEHVQGLPKAAVVSILAGATLVMTAFMNIMAEVSSNWCATLLGLTAAAQLLALRRAPPAWKGWLLAIGGGLSLIAIGVGLEGASRAMALAASALGLILIAHALDRARADTGAALYWAISVAAGFHAWDSGAAGTVPLAISGLVALGAGHVNKTRPVGLFYALTTPLVLGLALLQHRIGQPQPLLTWFLLWAIVATFAGRRLQWFQLRASALWLLPAGLFLFVSMPHDMAITQWSTREALLAAWVAGCACLLHLYRRDPDAPHRMDPTMLSRVTLAIPVLATVELLRAFDTVGFGTQAMLATIILLWAAWSVVASALTALSRFDWQTRNVMLTGGVLLAVGIALAKPAVLTELSQWTGIGLLAFVAWRERVHEQHKLHLIAGLAGAVLLGTLLRAIGTAYDLDDGAMALLFERAMQPWVSLLWAVGGVTVIVTASQRRWRRLWVGGGIALALLAAKMLLVDLAALTLIAKVTVFLLVGMVFIGIGYFCPLPPESGQNDADATTT